MEPSVLQIINLVEAMKIVFEARDPLGIDRNNYGVWFDKNIRSMLMNTIYGSMPG